MGSGTYIFLGSSSVVKPQVRQIVAGRVPPGGMHGCQGRISTQKALEIKRQPGDITPPFFFFFLIPSFFLPSFLPSLHPRPLPPLYEKNMQQFQMVSKWPDSNKLLSLLAGENLLDGDTQVQSPHRPASW